MTSKRNFPLTVATVIDQNTISISVLDEACVTEASRDTVVRADSAAGKGIGASVLTGRPAFFFMGIRFAWTALTRALTGRNAYFVMPDESRLANTSTVNIANQRTESRLRVFTSWFACGATVIEYLVRWADS